MATQEVDDSLEKILREQHGDIQVLLERQTEINRRIGLLEAKVDRILALEASVLALEADQEKRQGHLTWLWQTPLGAILTLVAIWAASKMGIPIVGP